MQGSSSRTFVAFYMVDVEVGQSVFSFPIEQVLTPESILAQFVYKEMGVEA